MTSRFPREICAFPFETAQHRNAPARAALASAVTRSRSDSLSNGTQETRRMGKLKQILFLAALALAGCGGPSAKLDTTTDESTQASLKAMTEGMSDSEKKTFESDCEIALLPGQYDTSQPKGNGLKDKYRTLN